MGSPRITVLSRSWAVTLARADADLGPSRSAAEPRRRSPAASGQHVPVELAERARAAAAGAGIDVVVAIGGSSATGLAKAVA